MADCISRNDYIIITLLCVEGKFQAQQRTKPGSSPIPNHCSICVCWLLNRLAWKLALSYDSQANHGDSPGSDAIGDRWGGGPVADLTSS